MDKPKLSDVIPDVLTGVSNIAKTNSLKHGKINTNCLDNRMKENFVSKDSCDDGDIEIYSLDKDLENQTDKNCVFTPFKINKSDDRDNVRRKLAMSLDDDYFEEDQSKTIFVNESVNDFDDETVENMLRKTLTINKPDVIPLDENNEGFKARKERLQVEAKIALAQVGSLAHMQLVLEKKNRKQTGLMAESDEYRFLKSNRPYLDTLNVTQLQIIVNNLHTEIEELNAELMKLLVERDELHMAQDSMLVDVQDLTGLAQEYCSKETIKFVKSEQES